MQEIARWPKAELHLHLEGALDAEVLCEIDPALDPAEVARRLDFQGFDGFIEAFKWATSFLRGPDEYALVADRLFHRLAQQNVRYAEVTLSVGTMLWRELDPRAVYEAVNRVASRHPEVEVWWIFDAIRHFGPEAAWPVVKLAVEYAQDRVVAFGLGGDERRGPASWFAGILQFARRHGLRLTLHAGETAGPESIWDALRCGADRIGHGTSAVQSPELVDYLRVHQIPVEICVTSNLKTGAWPSIRTHPVRQLFEAGVPVIISTDDPGLFGTSLLREYELLHQELGFRLEELQVVAANAFRFAFRRLSREPLPEQPARRAPVEPLS